MKIEYLLDWLWWVLAGLIMVGILSMIELAARLS